MLQEAQEPKEHIRESIVIKLRPVPRRKKVRPEMLVYWRCIRRMP